MSLVLCCSCARHVKATETNCPFCGDAAHSPAPTTPSFARVARSTMLIGATAAAVAVTIAACAPSAAYGGCPNCEPPDASADAADGGG